MVTHLWMARRVGNRLACGYNYHLNNSEGQQAVLPERWRDVDCEDCLRRVAAMIMLGLITLHPYSEFGSA